MPADGNVLLHQSMGTKRSTLSNAYSSTQRSLPSTQVERHRCHTKINRHVTNRWEDPSPTGDRAVQLKTEFATEIALGKILYCPRCPCSSFPIFRWCLSLRAYSSLARDAEMRKCFGNRENPEQSSPETIETFTPTPEQMPLFPCISGPSIHPP